MMLFEYSYLQNNGQKTKFSNSRYGSDQRERVYDPELFGLISLYGASVKILIHLCILHLMQVLCIDVGRGTQDILLYDSSHRNMENCSSFILPSPVALTRQALQQAVSQELTPLFYGSLMGGFSLKPYLDKLHSLGLKALAGRSAAKSFNDDLEEVASWGVTLIEDERAASLLCRQGIYPIFTQDVRLQKLLDGLERMGIGKVELTGIAVAVQDHGEAPPGVSDRKFRFENYQKQLESDTDLLGWAYRREEIPACLTRMKAVADSLPKSRNVLVMDTGIAAVLGCLEDEQVASCTQKVLLNLGNAHALGVYMDGEEILGLWEHHTQMLTPEKVSALVEKLLAGNLDAERLFADGGHGVYIRKNRYPERPEAQIIAVTGPRRQLAADLGWYQAAPYGNMMLTGAYGLLRAYQAKYGR